MRASDIFAINCESCGRRLETARSEGRPAESLARAYRPVTLEPLRPWAAHVVQLRSIAAVREDGSDGPQNGHEIHARFPHAIFPAHVVAGRCGQDMEVIGQQCGIRSAAVDRADRSAPPVRSTVMPGLDPGIHLLCKKSLRDGWIA